jgi:predicted SprT family Zn-dependent metalloprotease
VLDTEARLRCTLSHEMCHVASWAVSREFKSHHGADFKAWARAFEAAVQGIRITTTHSYDIFKPHRWQCSNAR